MYLHLTITSIYKYGNIFLSVRTTVFYSNLYGLVTEILIIIWLGQSLLHYEVTYYRTVQYITEENCTANSIIIVESNKW